MILGITGKSGVGKSTISNYINSITSDFEIIEVDNVVKYVLENNGIKRINKEMQERYGMGPYKKHDITLSFFRDSIEDKMLDELFKMEIDLETLKRVNEITNKGKNVIIDWYLLEYSIRLMEICDKMILLTSPMELRKQRVIERGNYKPEIFLLNEKSHDPKNEGKYDYIIDTSLPWKNIIQNIVKKDMLSSPLISVIVPIYNSDKYLDECIRSIRKQSYSNLEIILVNDGSTDRSLEICMSHKENDGRIKIINQRNQGVCSARNRGLKIAKGDYVAFVDSDDFIDNKMYEILLKDIRKFNADISRCRAYIYERDGKIRNARKTQENILYSTPKEIMEAYIEGKVSIGVWDKLFKRDVLNGIEFKEDIFNEDAVFVWDVCQNISKIVYTSLQLYHHMKRTDNSLTLVSFNEKHLTLDEYSRIQMENILKKGNNYKNIAINFRFNSLIHILKRYKRDLENNTIDNLYLKEIKNVIKCLKELLENNANLIKKRKVQEAKDIINLVEISLDKKNEVIKL